MTTPPASTPPGNSPEPKQEPTPPPPSQPVQVFRERRARAIGWHSKDIVRAAALVIGMYLLIKLLWFAHALVIATFLGILFGLAVEAGVDRLERFRIPRGIGAAIIVLGFFGALVGFGAAMAPTVREQSQELREKVPEAVDKLQDWVDRRRNGFLGLFIGRPSPDAVAGTSSGATTDATATTDTARPATEASAATTDTTGKAQPTESLGGNLGRQMSGAARFLFPFLSQTVAVIAGILLIIFMSIYIAADPKLYHRGLMHMFPHRARDRAGEVLSAIATVLRRWLVTQLIAMVVIGAVTTVALLILDVKAAFALGLIAGLFEFIPTIGPILSAVPAVAMAFLDSPEKAVTVIAVYVGIQFLENHILIPMLMKGGVDVPPVLTILGQALFTLLFGFLGLMVAVPVLAAVMVVVKMLYVEGVVGDDVAVVHAGDDG